ncbi:hypothetical protein [Flavobacterium algicola]|uniref:hypothetical protein n=1 Tax=Flavobacterium algicola TaxID=556529 RepID=UPI001EFD43F1|nr:hypothetical protein [Flavobacterium algicola]MCG9790951.1 hypothetical protein [Flavobacterium algicola]
MNAILIFHKIAMGGYNLMVSTFTNDLLINATQSNYFEMFLLSLTVECKNVIIPNNFSMLAMIDYDKINLLKNSLSQIKLVH